jgi:solute carrier family 25 phosphate transporter 23/24/25/41
VSCLILYAIEVFLSVEHMAQAVELSKKSNKPTIDVAQVKSFVAGGIAGIVSRTAVSPLERLKILYQIQHITGHDVKAKYTTPIQSLKRILQEEGVKGFFKGNGANCIRVFPYAGIQFWSMSEYSKAWKSFTGSQRLNAWEKQFVGGFAGLTSVILTFPLDMIRGRLTAQGGAIEKVQYKGLLDGCIQVFRKEGIRGLYAGVNVTLIGIYPYVALNYTTYETLKEHAPYGDTFAWRVFAGTCSGSIGQSAAYPFDLLRRRFQIQAMPGNPLLEEKRYKGVVDAFRVIYRTEGIIGFYKGFFINFVKTAPTIAIMFVVNDYIMDLLGR